MGKLKAIELFMLIGNLALNSMNTQLLFNEAHEADKSPGRKQLVRSNRQS